MKTLTLILLIGALLAAPLQAADELPVAAVRRAVERFVLAATAAELAVDERVEVRTRWRVPIKLAPAGEPRIEVERLSSRALRGPTVLRLRILVDDRVQSEMSVTADVRYLRPALVARRGMRRGEALTEDLLELQERDITRVRGRYYTDAGEIDGLRLRRSVRAGDLLTDQYTEPVPVIARGDQIQLVAQSANLRIIAAAVALQDGGIGARIRVRNTDSGNMVYGRVQDRGTVRVVLP
jgi:flagellar basal body P-ring formation protein FlgA